MNHCVRALFYLLFFNFNVYCISPFEISSNDDRFSITFPDTYTPPNLYKNNNDNGMVDYVSITKADKECEKCNYVFELCFFNVSRSYAKQQGLEGIIRLFINKLGLSIDSVEDFTYMGKNQGLRILGHGDDPIWKAKAEAGLAARKKVFDDAGFQEVDPEPLVPYGTTPPQSYGRLDAILVNKRIFIILYLGPTAKSVGESQSVAFFDSFKAW